MEELIIKERQTRAKIESAINESNLPAFVLTAICKDMLVQLQQEEQRQFNEAYGIMQKKIKEEQEKKEEKKGDDDNGND
jgi:uncharacterized protein involved in exopolysaccharide biosynthesis